MEKACSGQLAKRGEARPKRKSGLGKSLDVLHLLAEGESRFTDIQRSLGHANATTHRLLKGLIDAGLVIQDPVTKDYLPSNEILRLAEKIERGFADISIVARPEMERLRELSKETICLCKRVGLRKIIFEELTSFQGIKFEYGKGYSSSFHSGATGTALLSMLDDDEVGRLIEKSDLVQETPQTIVEKSQILARVSQARKDGYAISYGEVTPGTASVSVPLQDGTRSCALTVVGPANRFFPQTMVTETMESAQRIQAAMTVRGRRAR